MRKILVLLALLALPATAYCQPCKPKAVSATGSGNAYFVVVDGSVRSHHSRENTAISAGVDSLYLAQFATIEVRSLFDILWRRGSSDCSPTEPEPPIDPDPDPEPEPEPSTKLAALFDTGARIGPLPTRYLELYEHWGQIHHDRQVAQETNSPGNGWTLTYYDRGFGAYGMAAVTGDTSLIERGDYSVLQYRDDYVLPNDGGVPPRWLNPEGMTAHALRTGDPESIRAVILMADKSRVWIDRILDTPYRDGRIQGRPILAQQMAFLLTEDQKYADASQLGIDRLIEWFGVAGNGSWDSGALPGAPLGQNEYCDGMATFQITHAILYALIRHHQLIVPVPRLNEVLTKTLDRTWTFWTPGEGLAYIQPPEGASSPFNCEGSGTDNPAADLSLLTSTAFRYGHRFTGLDRFRVMAEEIEAHGLGGSVNFPTIFMSGSKQFNQSFFRSWRHGE